LFDANSHGSTAAYSWAGEIAADGYSHTSGNCLLDGFLKLAVAGDGELIYEYEADWFWF